jgi:hypothetical protein
MPRRRKSINPFQHLSRFLALLLRFLGRVTNLLIRGLLKTIQRMLPRQNRRRSMAAGFVLPTVVMVSLVVVLVTTAVMIRSFDRSKNASNFRVNEAVLNAATPALDRARAKISRLFSPDETNLPIGTPDDRQIKSAFEAGLANYTFQDEESLVLTFGGKELKTAWRYPVDTNNNGKFDSFTLYGIYFNDPTTSRTPLDARSKPMDDGQSQSCSTGTDNIGNWVKTGSGVLKKAFFSYVATVPIGKDQIANLGSDYEEYVGNKGFSALEMQQDQSRLSLDNNAVFYEDDLGITFAPRFFVNGRVHTNSNLLVSAPQPGNEVVFLQVSSPVSCFYKPENSLISVAGNVAAGNISEDTDVGADLVKVHLFRGESNNPTKEDNAAGNEPEKNPLIPSINGLPSNVPNFFNKTTDKLGGKDVAYNDLAYQNRLSLLTTGALNLFNADPEEWEKATPALVDAIARFPRDVKESFKAKYNPNNPLPTLLRNTLENYFKERIRKVPFAEIPINSTNDATKLGGVALTTDTIFPTSRDLVDESGATVIAPPESWMDPSAANTKLTPRYLPTLDPQLVSPTTKQNDYLGDRVVVGNNLPYRWFNEKNTDIIGPPTTKKRQFAKPGSEKPLSGISWLQPANATAPNTAGGTSGERKLSSRVVILDDIADTSRSGFWEDAAATSEAKVTVTKPDGTVEDQFIADDVRGGLRVVTGAGLYVDGCPTEGTFPTGFPCNGSKGLGQRSNDPTATILTTRSFLPEPKSLGLKLEEDPANAGVFLLEPSSPAADGEDPVAIKLPNGALLTGEQPIVVWPDSMPMWEDRNLDGAWDIDGWHSNALTEDIIKGLDLKGDLQMRASVVYHYKSGKPDFPIACVSSYYDPSNTISANASDGLAVTTDRRANSKSSTPLAAGTVATATNGRSYAFSEAWRTPSGDDLVILQRQAAMVFPDGRLVNEPLRTALQKAAADLTLADKAAIDAAMCALKILDGTATAADTAVPNGAIKEATLVDARQVKAIHKLNTDDTEATVNSLSKLNDPKFLKVAQTYDELTLTSGQPNLYNLPIEQRQPMEIRVTELDLDILRKKTIGSGTGSGAKNDQEYLLPNSGIIYATRDDALPDLSSITNIDPKFGGRTNARLNKDLADKPSATDFKLDPTRRPNAIRLIRGSNLSRVNTFRETEKGLILATNIPVYIKADDKNAFNLHANPGTTTPIEEFAELVNLNSVDGGNFYDRQTKNLNFACRSGQPGCGVGDQWRPARIIADSITLLSNNFYDGVRSDSSFDQNNNGGNYLVESRLKNGFLWNSFGTSSEVANSIAPDVNKQSSYWTNGVTPIQRRIAASPGTVYKMEICLKLPVSACQPEDWKQTHKVKVGATNIEIDAGTTATLPTVTPSTTERLASIYRLPRRVAFKRNNLDGSILLVDNNNDLILGTLGDSTARTPVIIRKTATTAEPIGYVSATGTLPSNFTPQIETSTATGPALWFGGGSQQNLTLSTPATPAGAPTQFGVTSPPPVDFDANTAGAFYQQYLPEPDTTVTPNKGVVGLPQFLAPFDSVVPGASTMTEAAKYSFCIATTPVAVPPATTAAALDPGSGASDQLVVRTQAVTTPAAPGYLLPKVLPTEAQSTIPIPKADDTMPPTAIKPFETYLPANVPTYTEWTTSGIDKTGTGLRDCVKAVSDAIETFRTGLLAPAADITLTSFTTAPATPTDAVVITPPVTPATTTKVVINARPQVTKGTRKITYIDLGSTATGLPIPADTEITLRKGNEELAEPDPIFVIRGLSPDGIVIGDTATVSNGVKLILDGVSPNNVFWVSSRGITIADANPTPAPTAAVPNPDFLGHQLAGNFIGKNLIPTVPPALSIETSPLSIGNNTKVTAGRFLGFTGSNLREARTVPIAPEVAAIPPVPFPGSVPPKKTMEIWAMNSIPPTYEKLTNQPLMVPVLNIHSPAGSPGTVGVAANGRLDASGWIPRAVASTFNAVLVMGDSPARPLNPVPTAYIGSPNVDRAENNGGLVNFPRFLEAWENSTAPTDALTAKIAGSLIQYKKSVFASAPFEAINNPDLDTSLFFDTPAYTTPGLPATFKGFRYPGGANLFRSPYYRAPFRAWGYDVGLLNQSADLFSKRFSLPLTARPSEFFREVSRDDAWVKTLLCGKVADTSSPSNGKPAVDNSQRPGTCPA